MEALGQLMQKLGLLGEILAGSGALLGGSGVGLNNGEALLFISGVYHFQYDIHSYFAQRENPICVGF